LFHDPLEHLGSRIWPNVSCAEVEWECECIGSDYLGSGKESMAIKSRFPSLIPSHSSCGPAVS
jgi:hypothetical protein